MSDEQGFASLFIASQNGHLDVVRLLLQKGADKDKANNNGTTPLLFASLNGHLEIVLLLLQKGADKDKANHNGMTPLFFASLQGHLVVECWSLVEFCDLFASGDFCVFAHFHFLK